MKLTVEQLQERMQYIRDHVEAFNTEERCDALNKMYDHFEERMILAPASSTDYFHNSWPGGYIDHVMNITEAGKKLFELYKEFGFKLSYDLDSVVFCTMHHDLGKLGSLEEDYYRPNPSEWHRINQGKMYEFNEDLVSMRIGERSIYYCMMNDVKLNEEEYQAIVNYDKSDDDKQSKWYSSSLSTILRQANELSIIECKNI